MMHRMKVKAADALIKRFEKWVSKKIDNLFEKWGYVRKLKQMERLIVRTEKKVHILKFQYDFNDGDIIDPRYVTRDNFDRYIDHKIKSEIMEEIGPFIKVQTTKEPWGGIHVTAILTVVEP